MSTRVEKTVLVNVPVSTAYNQWTQFEDFPHFMNGIKKVTQLSDDRLEWVAELAGVRRQWEAKILEQVPDRKVAWAATEGATNAGEVSFEDIGGGQTRVHLTLEYEPEGLIEKIGDKLNVVENQAEGDLERFKAFIESESYASGAWRGTINDGATGVEDADASRGDSGKAGVSGKVAAAGIAAAAAAAVGVAAAAKSKSSEDVDVEEASIAVTPTETYTPVETVDVVGVDTAADYDTSLPATTSGSTLSGDPAVDDVLAAEDDTTLDRGNDGRSSGNVL
jgi:ribosome-associated toxin RatA of RatAB toxin-antitoxin module